MEKRGDSACSTGSWQHGTVTYTLQNFSRTPLVILIPSPCSFWSSDAGDATSDGIIANMSWSLEANVRKGWWWSSSYETSAATSSPSSYNIHTEVPFKRSILVREFLVSAAWNAKTDAVKMFHLLLPEFSVESAILISLFLIPTPILTFGSFFRSFLLEHILIVFLLLVKYSVNKFANK